MNLLYRGIFCEILCPPLSCAGSIQPHDAFAICALLQPHDQLQHALITSAFARGLCQCLTTTTTTPPPPPRRLRHLLSWALQFDVLSLQLPYSRAYLQPHARNDLHHRLWPHQSEYCVPHLRWGQHLHRSKIGVHSNVLQLLRVSLQESASRGYFVAR